jgi:hypothetical protein
MNGQAVTLAASTVPTIAFDYDLVAEDYQGTLMGAAERIKSRLRQQTADFIAIGHDLLTIKADLDHGLFLRWVAAEFGLSPRTCQRYMGAAEWLGGKSDTVSYLPPTLIYALASENTPDEIKKEVRADLDAGKPVDVKAVKVRIKDARRAVRQPEPPIHYVPPPPKIDLLPTPKQQAEAGVEIDIYDRLFGPLTGAEWMQLGEDCYRRPIRRGLNKRPGRYSDEFTKLVAHFSVPLRDLEAAQ